MLNLALSHAILTLLTRYCEEQFRYTPQWLHYTDPQTGFWMPPKDRVTNLHNRWQVKPYVIFTGQKERIVDKADIWPWLDATGVNWRRGASMRPDQMHPERTRL